MNLPSECHHISARDLAKQLAVWCALAILCKPIILLWLALFHDGADWLSQRILAPGVILVIFLAYDTLYARRPPLILFKKEGGQDEHYDERRTRNTVHLTLKRAHITSSVQAGQRTQAESAAAQLTEAKFVAGINRQLAADQRNKRNEELAHWIYQYVTLGATLGFGRDVWRKHRLTIRGHGMGRVLGVQYDPDTPVGNVGWEALRALLTSQPSADAPFLRYGGKGGKILLLATDVDTVLTHFGLTKGENGQPDYRGKPDIVEMVERALADAKVA